MDILFILQIFIGFIGLVALAIPFSDNFKMGEATIQQMIIEAQNHDIDTIKL